MWYVGLMSHTIKDKKRLLHRVRRIGGQIAAVDRALVEERGCDEVLLTLAASRGAIHSLMAELIAEHLSSHVVDPASKVARRRGADEVVKAVRLALR